jgi:hypothetical protein
MAAIISTAASTATATSSTSITTTVPTASSTRPRSSRHLASSVPTKAIVGTGLAPDTGAKAASLAPPPPTFESPYR